MPRTFRSAEDIHAAVGQRLGESAWMRITQAQLNQFADATGDHQWLHVDPERAAQGPYGACIAHGYLTLALVNQFLPELVTVEGMKWGVNYGCDKVRFPAPVRVGAACGAWANWCGPRPAGRRAVGGAHDRGNRRRGQAGLRGRDHQPLLLLRRNRA